MKQALRATGGLLKALLLLFLLFPSQLYPADSGIVSINAAVISRGNCRFRNTPVTVNMTLDPSIPGNVSSNTIITITCTGGGTGNITYSITDDDGLWEDAPGHHRLKHTTLNEFIPYSFNYNPSGTIPKNSNVNININITILYNSFKDASAGSYSDTVTLTIAP